MPGKGVSHRDIEPDLQQIEHALMRISDARFRYWIAQFVELAADGVNAAEDRVKSSPPPRGGVGLTKGQLTEAWLGVALALC